MRIASWMVGDIRLGQESEAWFVSRTANGNSVLNMNGGKMRARLTRHLLVWIGAALSGLATLAAAEESPDARRDRFAKMFSPSMAFVECSAKTLANAGVLKKWHGSAFAIQPGGYFLTASHVLNGTEEIRSAIGPSVKPNCELVLPKNKSRLEFEVVDDLREPDIALLLALNVDASTFGIQPMFIGDSLGVRADHKLLCFGFVKEDINATNSMDAEFVEVKSLTGPNGTIVSKGFLEPGYSGGPCLDYMGKVVGIVIAGKIASRRDILVPVLRISSLLSQAGVAPQR